MRRLLWIALLLSIVGCREKERFLAPVTDTKSGPWEHPISVEEGKLDNGALACAADVLKPVSTHNDTKTAFANLAKTASDTIVIVGHGTPGSLCTGDGNTCTSRISNQNEKEWATWIGDIRDNKNIKTIRLIGCGVGYQSPGDELLKQLAKETGHTVLAPTVVVYCTDSGKVELDEGGAWAQQPPSNSPYKPASASPFSVQYLDLGPYAIPRFLPWKMVSVAELSLLKSDESSEFEQVPAIEANALVRQINFGRQFDPHGQPLARLTGRLVLKLNLPSIVFKVFLIYGDMVARDEENPRQFYRASEAFTNALIARRRR